VRLPPLLLSLIKYSDTQTSGNPLDLRVDLASRAQNAHNCFYPSVIEERRAAWCKTGRL
jgi:hypothetical protein